MASRIAFGVASSLDGAGFGAIRSELFAFGAGAVIELRVPGLRGAGVTHPGHFVTLLHMDLAMLLQYFSGVIDVQLVQLLGKSLSGAEQQRGERKAIQVKFHFLNKLPHSITHRNRDTASQKWTLRRGHLMPLLSVMLGPRGA